MKQSVHLFHEIFVYPTVVLVFGTLEYCFLKILGLNLPYNCMAVDGLVELGIICLLGIVELPVLNYSTAVKELINARLHS